jgi:hypothetical protein
VIKTKGNCAGEGKQKITAAVHGIKQTRAVNVYDLEKT